MRWLLAKTIRLSVVGLLVFSASTGVASGQATNDAAPAVVAHFHLSGMLSESPVADPFGLMAGEMTLLKDLVRRMDKASTDDKVKAVILTFDGMQLGLGQLQEVRQAVEHIKAAGKKVYVHAEDLDTRTYALLCAGSRLSLCRSRPCG